MDDTNQDKPDAAMVAKCAELQKTQEQNNVATRILRILSVPVAALVGGYYTNVAVRKRLYTNFWHQGFFKSHQAERHKQYQEAIAAARAGILEDPPKVFSEIENLYRDKVAEGELAKIGLKNFSNYFRGLERHQKTDVVFYSATITGVMLGGMLSLANNIGWVRKFLVKEIGGNDDTPSATK